MSFSFYKKGSNAKIMNNLNFSLISNENDLIIKNNKMENKLELTENEKMVLNGIQNIVYRTFYSNIILIKNGIEWIFNNTEEKFHKYINIKIKCYSIYAENTLKEWMYIWFEQPNIKDENKLIYMDEIENIYNQFKKCKISIN